MESQIRGTNKKIFRSELTLLKEEEYISAEHYELTLKAHYQYYSDLEAKKQELNFTPAIEKPIKTLAPQVKKVEKRKLTQEEIRERNISWSLNLGVILLLIGGLFVATSNWDSMSAWMKSGSIAFVSLLFYGISYISIKVLKIERTSFAFIVLGSLFLPIFILTIGWFELLGSFLSFYGEGKYILGALGSYFLVPIYSYFAKSLNSRLFVWFSYIVLSAGMGFSLAAFHLGKDGFYLGMMLFNGLLAVGYHWLKKQESLKLFSKELIYFAQINLVLSTLLMLVFFNSHVLYSINVLLTAAVYLSMVYVSGRKEYHFVFSILIVYGSYQLIEYSILDSFGPVLYALVGVSFLAVPKVMDGHYHWDKVFRLTSAVISVFAFLFISVEGILLRMNDPSFVMLLAYIIITVQFTYLASEMKNGLFVYLSPIFLASALYEVVLMADQIVEFTNFILPVFLIGFMISVLIGYTLKYRIIKIIVPSSRDVGMAIMFFTIVIGLGMFDWLNSGIMLLLFSFVLVLSYKMETRSFYSDATPLAIPLSFGLAFMVFGEELRSGSAFYHSHLGMAMNALLASVSVLLLTYIWKMKKNFILMRISFFLAQGFYTVGMIASIILPVNETWMRPSILLGGTVMYLSFYIFTKFKWVPYIAAGALLISYFSTVYALHLNGPVPVFIKWIQLPFGAFLLLAAGFFLSKKDQLLAKGFSWVGHIYMPLALLLTFLLSGENSIWSFMAALAVYWISSRMSMKEWKVKVFLYSSFLSCFMVVSTGIHHYFTGRYGEFAYLLVSTFVFVFWMYANKEDKQRTLYFLIPWSLIGICAFLTTYPFGWIPFMTVVLYSAGLISFLHNIKRDILTVFPLILLFVGTLEFLMMIEMDTEIKMLMSGGFGVGLALCGKLVYERLFQIEGENKKADSYTFIAFLFFLSMYLFQSEPLWAKILPGILISTLIFMQRRRVEQEYNWIPAIFSVVYLLQPYYTLLRNIEIPELISREMYVAPFVAIVIYIQHLLKGQYRKLTGHMQWAVLVIVSLLLIQDGLASSTVYDALILGTLSLVSMLAGTFLRVKSYFFVGSSVLLLNVLLQTRPYWGNLPWWAYLLITGSVLITVASYNEWHKQKTAKGEKTLFTQFKNNIMNKLKEWQ